VFVTASAPHQIDYRRCVFSLHYHCITTSLIDCFRCVCYHCIIIASPPYHIHYCRCLLSLYYHCITASLIDYLRCVLSLHCQGITTSSNWLFGSELLAMRCGEDRCFPTNVTPHHLVLSQTELFGRTGATFIISSFHRQSCVVSRAQLSSSHPCTGRVVWSVWADVILSSFHKQSCLIGRGLSYPRLVAGPQDAMPGHLMFAFVHPIGSWLYRGGRQLASVRVNINCSQVPRGFEICNLIVQVSFNSVFTGLSRTSPGELCNYFVDTYL
jgi:hypothetical protein